MLAIACSRAVQRGRTGKGKEVQRHRGNGNGLPAELTPVNPDGCMPMLFIMHRHAASLPPSSHVATATASTACIIMALYSIVPSLAWLGLAWPGLACHLTYSSPCSFRIPSSGTCIFIQTRQPIDLPTFLRGATEREKAEGVRKLVATVGGWPILPTIITSAASRHLYIHP